MKNFNVKLITALLFLFLVTNKIYAQEGAPQTVMLYVHSEIKGGELLKDLIVISPDDQYEVAMEKRTVKTRKESDVLNLKIVYNEINKWKQKGYKIDTTESDSMGLILVIMSKD